VLLVERDRVGGAGIHAGALSSKTLWHLSNDYAIAARTDRGYAARQLEVSYQAVMDTVRNAVTECRRSLELQLEYFARPSEHGGQLWFRRGTARFHDPNTVEVTESDGSATLYAADRFLIATGSRPRLPAGIDVDETHVVTSDHIETLDHFPESMVIV